MMSILFICCDSNAPVVRMKPAKRSSCWRRSATRTKCWTRRRIRSATWSGWWVTGATQGLEPAAARLTRLLLLLLPGSRPGVRPDREEGARRLEGWKRVSEEDARGRWWSYMILYILTVTWRESLVVDGIWSNVFFTAGDVHRRRRTDHGWNSRFHRLPKGESHEHLSCGERVFVFTFSFIRQ